MKNIRHLKNEDITKFNTMYNTLKTYIDLFGIYAVDKSSLIGNIPASIKYSDEYITQLYPLLYPDDGSTIFNVLFKETGYYCIRDNSMIKYIAKNYPEDIPEIISILAEEINNCNVMYISNNIEDIFKIVKTFMEYMSADDKPTIIDTVFNSQLLDKLYSFNRSLAIDYIDDIIITTTTPIECAESIAKRFPEYSNYPIIIFNDNITKEERIEFIKKTFVQKNICKYMNTFQEKMKDFSLLDDFITATVTQNNKVKEKEIATRNVLERFFLGMGNTSQNKSWSVNQLMKIQGVEDFMNKYAKYLPLKYCLDLYNNRYTTKNRNIEVYSNLYITLMGKTPIEKIKLARYVPRSLGIGCVNNVLLSLGDIDRDTDTNVLKEIVAYDSEVGNVLLIPYNLLTRGYGSSVLLSDTEKFCKLMNMYPEIFAKFFAETKIEDSAQSPSYSAFIRTYFNKYINSAELKEEYLYKFTMLSEDNLRNFFLEKNVDNRRYCCADEIMFALDYFKDIYARMERYTDQKMKAIADSAMITKLSIYTDTDIVQDAISSISSVFSRSYQFKKYFMQCSSNIASKPFDMILQELISVMKNIVNITTMSDEDKQTIDENLSEIENSAMLLLNI